MFVCHRDFSLKDCISLRFSPSCGDVSSKEEEWAILFYHLCEYMHPLLEILFAFALHLKILLKAGAGNLFKMYVNSEGERKVRLGRQKIQSSYVNEGLPALGIWGSLTGDSEELYRMCCRVVSPGMGEAGILIYQLLFLLG